MNKIEFLSELKKQLEANKVKDSGEIVSFHEEIIDGKIELGHDEKTIIANYQSISSIVSELLDEEKKSGGFSYRDYVNESFQVDYKTSKPIESKRIGDARYYTIDVNKQSAIDLSINSRKVHLKASNDDKMIVKYHNTLGSAIDAYQEDDNVLIKERHRGIVFRILAQIIIFAALFFLASQIFSLTRWWHYLLTFIAVSSIFELWWLIYFSLIRGKTDVYITVPNSFIINKMNIVVRSGKLFINNLVVNDLNTRLLSGTATIEDTFANCYDIKVSSGKLLLGKSSAKLNKMAKSIILNIRSGKATINGISASEMYTKVSSGRLVLNNTCYPTSNFKISSGSVRGEDVILNDATLKVSSGRVVLNSVVLEHLNFSISSGSLKANDIIGSSDDYVINARVKSGTMRINNQLFNNVGYKLVNKIPEKALIGSVSSGRVIFNFKSDLLKN